LSALTIVAALGLAAACQHSVEPVMIVGIAQHESGLDPARVHLNADGSGDFGLMQINSRNFAWLGLDERTALDPCRSIAAAAAVLTALSRYNSGSPTRSLPYAEAVSARIKALSGSTNSPASPTAPEEDVDLNDRPAGITTLTGRGN
jgi:soluble lytic murein transglycosylase-like protein